MRCQVEKGATCRASNALFSASCHLERQLRTHHLPSAPADPHDHHKQRSNAKLNHSIGIPPTFSDFNISKPELHKLAKSYLYVSVCMLLLFFVA